MRPVTIVGRLMLGSCLLMGLSSCTEMQPRDLAKHLSNSGWTYVDVPRQLLGPGTIVTIAKETGITYRGNIAECIDDARVTKPVTGGIALEGVMNKTVQFSADAFGSYQGFSLGPEFSKVATYKLTLKNTTEYALSDIAVRNWLEANAHNLSSACRDYLGYASAGAIAANVFILVNVVGVEKYEYTFYDKQGAKIALSADMLANFATPKANANWSVTKDGSLTSDTPVFLAFKKGVPAKPVGQGAIEDLSATAEMETYLKGRALL